MIDHVLLVGFGGPEKPGEVWPFLQRLTAGTRIPESRLREVERHYQATGGSSPYNRHAERLAGKIREELQAGGTEIPLFLGMRNWRPFLADVEREIAGQGLRRGLAVVLAPHRSEASFGRYQGCLEAACRETGGGVEYEFLPSWHDHPLFIGAQTERVRPLLSLTENPAHLLFTAHSIPLEMARACGYEAEIHASSRGVAEALGVSDWSVAYQSRSGSPAQPWLEPDVLEVIRRQKEGAAVVAVPIGFLFDHTEVLYDLDREAKTAAEGRGLRFLRAPTVMDHPQFIRMFADLIRERVFQGAQR